ncbi:Rib/alpha-like domain-containing protein, partial [Dietzia sp. ANT_WB102]|uniref:Rib/alpha-like domain-containing protein n=1 Tax=Dietzia sp. ANT_WB102 TaxID=2597345 RepID=UPI002714F121
MFLVATFTPVLFNSAMVPAANAAPVVSGATCKFTEESITGSTWIQANGRPGGSLPASDTGATKLPGASFQFRYTLGDSNAEAAVGPWSEWIAVTSGPGGDYCVSGLNGFRPTTGGIRGSLVQFEAADQTVTGTPYVPASLPGHGNAVQAQIDPNSGSTTWGTVDPATRSVYNYQVQFMQAPPAAGPMGADSQQSDCRLRIGGINYDNTNCASIRGAVGVEQVLGRETRDGADYDVAGATVCAQPTGTTIVRCDTTDSDGDYEINFLGSDRWDHNGHNVSFNMNSDRFTMWVIPPSGYRTFISRPFAQGVKDSLASDANGGYLVPGTITKTGHTLTQFGRTIGNLWTFALAPASEEALTVPAPVCPAPDDITVEFSGLISNGAYTYSIRVGGASGTTYPIASTADTSLTIPAPTAPGLIELVRTQASGNLVAVPQTQEYTPLDCPSKTDADEFTPSYAVVSAPVGVKATSPVSFVDGDGPVSVPAGTVFELGDGAPAGASVDPTSGVVSYTPPVGTDLGTVGVPVTVTYADSSSEETTATFDVTAAPVTDADENVPVYSDVEVQPGESVTVEQTADLPAGTEFAVEDGFVPPAGWTVVVDPDTGAVTVTAPEGAAPGTELTVPVTVTYPDGSVDEAELTVTVGDPVVTDADENVPVYSDVEVQPGESVTVEQTADLPAGTEFAVEDGF